MNRKRIIIGLVFAAVVVGICFGFRQLQLSNHHPSINEIRDERISFRLKWVIYSSFAHHFVALEKGFFKQEKLDVSIRPGGAGLDPIKLVASGADDVGLAG
jgi:ABC-type nitrate/sulfonate/bicarbonate transport system substrate-binding protein